MSNIAQAPTRTRTPSEPHRGVATTYWSTRFHPTITYVVGRVVAREVIA